MLQSEAGYIDARPLTASSTKSSCNARPDHTLQRTAGPYIRVNRYRWLAAGPDGKSALARNPT